jgi:hypothetical protein
VAALNHPNICQLYDVGPNYLVMELVEGSKGRCRWRKNPPGPLGRRGVSQNSRESQFNG